MEGLRDLNSRRDDGAEQEEMEDKEGEGEEQRKEEDRNSLSSPIEGSGSSLGLSPGRVSINAERLGQPMESVVLVFNVSVPVGQY